MQIEQTVRINHNACFELQAADFNGLPVTVQAQPRIEQEFLKHQIIEEKLRGVPADMLSVSAYTRQPARDIDIAGIITLRNVIQLVSVVPSNDGYEIRFLQELP